MNHTPTAYDTVEYPSSPLPQTHPSRLGAIARLHGLAAAPPSACRILEVGCGDGANLLPLALAYPASTFIGIDLSVTAIARGEAVRTRLGLSNLELRTADLMDGTPPGDGFDYIIAHGFYSWVPAFVRDALFAVCRERLRPAGLAYVSYNALPGCHVRRMLADMLKFHVRGIADPREKIEQAGAFLQFLAQGVTGTGPYSDLLREEVRQVADEKARAVLFHDDLADINDPVTITDFVAHASQFGLRFLAEADYYEMTGDLFPPSAAAVLRDLAATDTVKKEQYLDFLRLRRFRQTILCRADALVRAEPDPAAIRDFAVCGAPVPEPLPADLTAGIRVKFRSGSGAIMTVDHPLAKAALILVGERSPHSITVPALLAAVRKRTGVSTDDDAEMLERLLLSAYRIGMVDLQWDAPRYVTAAGPLPRLSPLARIQLESGEELISSLRHSVVRVDNPVTRELLLLLDGTRDAASVLSGLSERAAADPSFAAPGDPPRSAQWWRETLAPQIDAGIAMAATTAMLVEEN